MALMNRINTLDGSGASSLQIISPTITSPIITGGSISGSISASTASFSSSASITGALTITGANSTATLGDELLTNSNDRDFSSNTGNWTGTNWSIAGGVATHTAGANAFTHTLTATAGKTYEIVFTVVTTTTGTLTVSFGGANGRAIGQSIGTLTSQTQVITATTNGALTFTPNATWTGTLDNISVKEITLSSVVQSILNSDGSAGIEIRSGGSSYYNTFVGIDVGRATYHTTGSTGYNNSALGYQALYSNTIGMYNTAVSYQSLYSNTTGYSNSAMGYSALYSNTSGDANSAMGSVALYSNTTGYYNSAMGFGALRFNTTGYYNSAMGFRALYSNATGYSNSAMGHYTLYSNTTGSYNTALGHQAGYSGTANTTENANTFIGYGSGLSVAGVSSSTAIGVNARVGRSNSIVLGGTGVDAVNVGIGTTTPYAKLSVVGPVVAEYFNATSSMATSTFAGYFGVGTSTPWGNGLLTVGTSSPLFYVDKSSGRVGIGTTSPAEMLAVSGRMFIGGTGTSTIENNLYVMGTLGSARLYTGDIIFGNNFVLTESDLNQSPQSLILKNQNGETILTIDENGNLTISGEIKSQNSNFKSDDQSIISQSFDWILEQFKNIGISIADGVINAKEFIGEKIFSDEITTKRLKMIDQATGEIYCTWIENGEWRKEKGECDITSPGLINDADSLEPTDEQETQAEQTEDSPPEETERADEQTTSTENDTLSSSSTEETSTSPNPEAPVSSESPASGEDSTLSE